LILIKAPLNHTRNRYDSGTPNLFPQEAFNEILHHTAQILLRYRSVRKDYGRKVRIIKYGYFDKGQEWGHARLVGVPSGAAAIAGESYSCSLPLGKPFSVFLAEHGIILLMTSRIYV